MQSYIYSNILKLPEPKSFFGNSDRDKIAEEISKNIADVQKDLNKSYDQLNIDQNLLCTFYRDLSKNKKDGLGAAEDVRNTIDEIRKWREQMEEEFLAYAKSGWGSGKTIEEMFDEIFNPLFQAVEGLTAVVSNMGLGQIPFINTLPKMLENFSNIGKIVRKLPKEVREAAEAEAAEAKAAEKQKEDDAVNAAGGNKTWARIAYRYNNDSMLKKLVDEIVELFKAFWDLMELIASCAEIFAIMIILDKFKPVIDQFKIMIGDAVNIISNIYDFLKLLIKGKFALIEFFGKLLWSKVEGLWNILVYVSVGQNIETNALISGCWMDIVSAQCDISAFELSIDCLQNQMLCHNDNKMYDIYNNKIDEVNGILNDLKSKTPLEVKEIDSKEKELDALKKKKDKLVSYTVPTHSTLFLNSLSSHEFFLKNIESIYTQALDKNMSLDKYLNPEKEEEKPATPKT